jgi:hypothetical protein
VWLRLRLRASGGRAVRARRRRSVTRTSEQSSVGVSASPGGEGNGEARVAPVCGSADANRVRALEACYGRTGCQPNRDFACIRTMIRHQLVFLRGVPAAKGMERRGWRRATVWLR